MQNFSYKGHQCRCAGNRPFHQSSISSSRQVKRPTIHSQPNRCEPQRTLCPATLRWLTYLLFPTKRSLILDWSFDGYFDNDVTSALLSVTGRLPRTLVSTKKNTQFVSAGYDRCIKLWDASRKIPFCVNFIRTTITSICSLLRIWIKMIYRATFAAMTLFRITIDIREQ